MRDSPCVEVEPWCSTIRHCCIINWKYCVPVHCCSRQNRVRLYVKIEIFIYFIKDIYIYIVYISYIRFVNEKDVRKRPISDISITVFTHGHYFANYSDTITIIESKDSSEQISPSLFIFLFISSKKSCVNALFVQVFAIPF